MSEYSGYLSPFMGLIRKRLAEEWKIRRIAEELYDVGARATYSTEMSKESQITSFCGIIRVCIADRGIHRPMSAKWVFSTPKDEEMLIRKERGEI